MRIQAAPHLYLEQFKPADEHALVKYINDEETLLTVLPMPNPYTAEDAKEWIKFTTDQYRRDKFPHNLAIRYEGDLVGSIGLRIISTEPALKHQAEIGYIIYKPWWRQGFASMAVTAFCSYVFQRLEFNRLTAVVFQGNKASERVLEKAGFHHEGFLRSHIRKGENYIDCNLFALLKNNTPDE